jgi:2-iminobutanoate/2-iminopropanoate deaminase
MTLKQSVHTDHAPKAIGPYSQAVRTGNLLFVSGQLGIDPATGKFAGESVEEQATRLLENMRHIVTAAGGNLGQVIKTTIFLADMGDFAKVNEVYGKFFEPPFPARSTIAVKGLPLNAKVEVEAVVALG